MFYNKKGRKFFSQSIQDAIKQNDIETLCQLTSGVNFNEIVDHHGTTLLHLSIRKKRDKIVKFCIENGCDINARDKTGTTPLLYAVKSVFYPAIVRLLEAKANVALSDNKGVNAFKFILATNNKNKSNLILAFASYLKKCELDIKELASLVLEAKWPIHYAVYIDNLELIRLMLETGCDVDSYDKQTDYCTALNAAIMIGDTEMIKILLKHGADPDLIIDRKFLSPLNVALKKPKIFAAFLDHGDGLLERFNCDRKMETFKMFSRVCYQVIELLLLKYKINLTTKDRRGNTFLHCLVKNRNRSIIDLLSKIDFDVNIRDDLGNTLLHAVIDRNYPSCMKMLIDKGADVNAKNNNGDTPLIVAISCLAEIQELEILIKNGVILDEEMQNRILTMVLENDILASVMHPVLERMAILNLQGNEISERNLNLIKSSTAYRLWEQFSIFSKELHFMKSHIITVASDVSVFDILSASEQKLLNYARNEKIVKRFAKINSKSIYPIYGKEMKTRFQLAIVKQNLIQNVTDTLGKNIEQLKCNSEVMENIVKYLSLNDLKCLSVMSPSV